MLSLHGIHCDYSLMLGESTIAVGEDIATVSL